MVVLNLTSLAGQTLGRWARLGNLELDHHQSFRRAERTVDDLSANQCQSNDGVKVTSLSVSPSAVPEPATFGWRAWRWLGWGWFGAGGA